VTIATQANRQDYTGNNCTKAFAYTFKIPATSDLDVFVGGVQKTLTTDYTVSGAGVETGGTVTFVTAPGCGLAVAIVRDVPYTQATDYPENDPFPALSHEDALDKLTMLVQQVKELTTRSWRFAAGSVRAAAGYVVDEPKALTFPRVKSDCTGIEFVTLVSCGTYADPVTTKGDLIQGNDLGSQERLGISAVVGSHLRVLETGKAGWRAGGVNLINKTDAQADAGRIFAIDTGCNDAFVVADVLACTRLYVAATEAIGDDCQGILAYASGPVTVLSAGQVARGDYVRKSATVGAVQTTCVNVLHHRPVPRGAIGVALSASLADCLSILVFPFTAPGQQGLATVRGNKSQSDQSTANSVCTKMTLLADSLILADNCNDIVVVRSPGSVTNDITVDNGNKDNGRDQSGSFTAGDIHFYWVYEGASGKLKTRASVVAPCDRSGPTVPACETHWAYSHSMYWNANCLHAVSVRGRHVAYDCARTLLADATASCETRVSLVTLVPLAATRVHVHARALLPTGGTVGDHFLLGHRLNCIAWLVPSGAAAGACNSSLLILPNLNQELFYRFEGVGTASRLTLEVMGYDCPNGDA